MISDLIGVLYFVFHCAYANQVDRRNNIFLYCKYILFGLIRQIIILILFKGNKIDQL